jgi:hypothetical protein
MLSGAVQGLHVTKDAPQGSVPAEAKSFQGFVLAALVRVRFVTPQVAAQAREVLMGR